MLQQQHTTVSSPSSLLSKKHIQDTPLTLPPQVQGIVYGYITLTIDYIVWSDVDFNENEDLPSSPNVRVQWWGEKGIGTLFRPQVIDGEESGVQSASASFNRVRIPILCVRSQFLKYLHDADTLHIQVFDSSGLNKLGKAIVSLNDVYNDQDLRMDSLHAVKSVNNSVLGSVHVSIKIEFMDEDTNNNEEGGANQLPQKSSMNANVGFEQLIKRGNRLHSAMEEELAHSKAALAAVGSGNTKTTATTITNTYFGIDPIHVDLDLFNDLFLERTKDVKKPQRHHSPPSKQRQEEPQVSSPLRQLHLSSSLPSYTSENNVMPAALAHDPMIALYLRLRHAKLSSPALSSRRKRNSYFTYQMFADIRRKASPLQWNRNHPLLLIDNIVSRVYSESLAKHFQQSYIIIEVWDRNEIAPNQSVSSPLRTKQQRSHRKKPPFRVGSASASPTLRRKQQNDRRHVTTKTVATLPVKNDNDVLIGLVKVPMKELYATVHKVFDHRGGWNYDSIEMNDLNQYVGVNGDYDIINPFSGEGMGTLNIMLALGRETHMQKLLELENAAHNAQRFSRGFLARKQYQRSLKKSSSSSSSKKKIRNNHVHKKTNIKKHNIVKKHTSSPIAHTKRGKQALKNIFQRVQQHSTIDNHTSNAYSPSLREYLPKRAGILDGCCFKIVVDDIWLPEAPEHEFTLRGPLESGVWFSERDTAYYISYSFYENDNGVIKSTVVKKPTQYIEKNINGRKVRACHVNINHEGSFEYKNNESLRAYLLNESLHLELYALTPSDDRLVGFIDVPLDNLVDFDGHRITHMSTIGGVFPLCRKTLTSPLSYSLLSRNLDGKIRIRIQVHVNDAVTIKYASPPTQRKLHQVKTPMSSPPRTQLTATLSKPTIEQHHRRPFNIELLILRAINLPLEYEDGYYVSHECNMNDDDDDDDDNRNAISYQHHSCTSVCYGRTPTFDHNIKISLPISYDNWRKLRSMEIVLKLWKTSEQSPQQNNAKSTLVGVASINLSPLVSGFKHLSGWYHLMNNNDSYGQIYTHIVPNDALKEITLQEQKKNEELSIVSAGVSSPPRRKQQQQQTSTKVVKEHEEGNNTSIQTKTMPLNLAAIIAQLEAMRLDFNNRLHDVKTAVVSNNSKNTANTNTIGLYDETLNVEHQQQHAAGEETTAVATSDNDDRRDEEGIAGGGGGTNNNVRIHANPRVTISPEKTQAARPFSQPSSSLLFQPSSSNISRSVSVMNSRSSFPVPWSVEKHANVRSSKKNILSSSLPLPWSIHDDDNDDDDDEKRVNNALFHIAAKPPTHSKKTTRRKTNIFRSPIRTTTTTTRRQLGTSIPLRPNKRTLSLSQQHHYRKVKSRKQPRSYDDYFTGKEALSSVIQSSSSTRDGNIISRSPLKRPRTPPPSKALSTTPKEKRAKPDESQILRIPPMFQSRAKEETERIRRIANIMKRTSI